MGTNKNLLSITDKECFEQLDNSLEISINEKY